MSARHRKKRKGDNEMKTVWFKSVNGGLYFFEELKLIWMEQNPKEKFELCNFNAWADAKGFKRI